MNAAAIQFQHDAAKMVNAIRSRMPANANGGYAAWQCGSTVRAWLQVGDARVDFTHDTGCPDSVVNTYADCFPSKPALNAIKSWRSVDVMRYPTAEAGLDQFFAIINLLLEQA